MVKYIITFVAGAVVWDFLKENSEESGGIEPQTFKVGDKGKDIAAFQEMLNKLLGTDFIKNVGVYDSDTRKVVIDVFEGTSALVDEETGAISKKFVLDFIKIIDKL